jgi:hypothetical protein
LTCNNGSSAHRKTKTESSSTERPPFSNEECLVGTLVAELNAELAKGLAPRHFTLLTASLAQNLTVWPNGPNSWRESSVAFESVDELAAVTLRSLRAAGNHSFLCTRVSAFSNIVIFSSFSGFI